MLPSTNPPDLMAPAGIELPVGPDGTVSFASIPLFPHRDTEVTVYFDTVEGFLVEQAQYGLDLAPDFQRGHKWTETQQSRFVEFLLQGGNGVANTILLNCCGYSSPKIRGTYTIVDGLQRLTAVRRFVGNEIPVFGHFRREFRDTPRIHLGRLLWVIVEIGTRAELLRMYLALNRGGTPHTDEDIARVEALLAEEIAHPTPPWQKPRETP